MAALIDRGMVEVSGGRMRIAYIVDSFPVVSETFILRQIQGLRREGHEVLIFAGASSHRIPQEHSGIDPLLLARVRLYNVKPQQSWRRVLKAMAIFPYFIVRAPQSWFRSLDIFKYGAEASSLNFYFQAFTFSEAAGYDAVVAHFGPNGIVGARMKALKVFRGRLFCFFHAYDLTSYVRRMGGNVYEELFRYAEKVFAVSERGRRMLIALSCPTEKLAVFHMGVDPEAMVFRPRDIDPGKRVKLVSVARLVEKKGIVFGLEAVKTLIERGYDIQYEVIGDGPLRTELELRAERLGLKARVNFTGMKDPNFVRHALNVSDIFLLPSVTADTGDEEGIPVVLMEALAEGIAVVACNSGAVGEIVIDGETGVLISSADAGLIADGVCRILKDPSAVKIMSRAGRRLVERQYNTHVLDQALVVELKGKQ